MYQFDASFIIAQYSSNIHLSFYIFQHKIYSQCIFITLYLFFFYILLFFDMFFDSIMTSRYLGRFCLLVVGAIEDLCEKGFLNT